MYVDAWSQEISGASTTSAVRGALRDATTRAEAISLITNR